MEQNVDDALCKLRQVTEEIKEADDLGLMIKISKTMSNLSDDINEIINRKCHTKHAHGAISKLAEKYPKAKDELLEFQKKLICTCCIEEYTDYMEKKHYEYEIRDGDKIIKISCGHGVTDRDDYLSWYLDVDNEEMEGLDLGYDTKYKKEWYNSFSNNHYIDTFDKVRDKIRFQNIDTMKVLESLMEFVE